MPLHLHLESCAFTFCVKITALELYYITSQKGNSHLINQLFVMYTALYGA